LVEIVGLEGRSAADIRGQLIEENGVVVAFLDVGGKVRYPES